MAAKDPPPYVVQWRWAIAQSDLPAVQRAIAWTMSLDMNADGGSCFPGMARLRRHSGFGLATVKRAVAGLVEAGFVVIVQRGGSPRDGARHATEFRAVIPNSYQSGPGSEMTRFTGDTDPYRSGRGPVSERAANSKDVGSTKSGGRTSDEELLARRGRFCSDNPDAPVPLLGDFAVGGRYGPQPRDEIAS